MSEYHDQAHMWGGRGSREQACECEETAGEEARREGKRTTMHYSCMVVPVLLIVRVAHYPCWTKP
eukprot:14605360-Alexandrium_andersonii.AAC.1